MTRKAAWWGFPFLLGCSIYCYFNQKLFWIFLVFFLIYGIVSATFFRKYKKYILCTALFAILGLVSAKAYTHFDYKKTSSLNGKSVTMTGYITDYSYISDDLWRIVVDGNVDDISAKIIFFCDGDFDFYDKITISADVKLIENSVKFNSRDYYLPKGIYLESNGNVNVINTYKCTNHFMKYVYKLRNFVSDALFQTLDNDQAGFLQALICGDKSEIDSITKTKFYRSGIGHLFAMSGTHLVAVSFLFNAVIGLFIHSKRIKCLLLEIIIITFMGFAGFSASVVRAGLMLSLIYCSDIFSRRADCLNSLGLCALLMCGTNPYIVMSPAFVLSFSASFAIGVICPKLKPVSLKFPINKIVNSLLSSLIILVITFPAQAFFFGQISVIAPLTNLLLVPVCTVALSLTLAAMILGGITLPAQIIIRLSGKLVNFTLYTTDIFSSFSFSSVPTNKLLFLIIFIILTWSALLISLKIKRVHQFFIMSLSAIVLLYTSHTIYSYVNKNKIKILILTDKYHSTAVISDGIHCSVTDIGCKGEFIYQIQNYINTNGIRYIDAAFCTSDLGVLKYKSMLYPSADNIITEFGYFSDPFTTDSHIDFENYSVCRTDSGYSIVYNNSILYISKNKINWNDQYVDLSKNDMPIEITLNDNNEFDIRRLDYAFN